MAISPELAEHLDEHHRNIQGGGARAAIFGISDGLVSNVSLILGIAAAESASTGIVRLAGIAGMIAGAVSMAAGEYVSMKGQKELLERELELERIEQERHPDHETAELAEIYAARGVDPEDAHRLSRAMSRTPELMLETHAREELGVDPNELGSPIQAMVSSFCAFAVGAFLPLVPWLFIKTAPTHAARVHDVHVAVVESIIIGALAALTVGAALARFTGKSLWWSASRQLLIASIAAAVTYGIGYLVGTGPVG
jgi:VIT1/CCC1 family predicted Fe2+/Mn2+ transporter